MIRDLVDEIEEALRPVTILDEPPTRPKRETPTGWIGAQEWNRIVPAARCKECGNVTWKLSLSGGPQKLVDTKKHGPVHEDGCSRPNGKLDIKHGLLND